MIKQNKVVGALFERWAPDYDRSLESYEYSVPMRLFGEARPYIDGKEGKIKLLDLGIGTGLSSRPFRVLPDIHVNGVDFSPRMLGYCRAKGLMDEGHQLDVAKEPLPFDDGSFDIVISSGLLEFIGNLDHVFTELSRVLVRGGLVLLAHESVKSKQLYRPGLITGVIDDTPGKVTIRRMMPRQLFPRFYHKYLYGEAAIRDAFAQVGIEQQRRKSFTAYRWSEKEAITYNLFTGIKS